MQGMTSLKEFEGSAREVFATFLGLGLTSFGETR